VCLEEGWADFQQSLSTTNMTTHPLQALLSPGPTSFKSEKIGQNTY